MSVAASHIMQCLLLYVGIISRHDKTDETHISLHVNCCPQTVGTKLINDDKMVRPVSLKGISNGQQGG